MKKRLTLYNGALTESQALNIPPSPNMEASGPSLSAPPNPFASTFRLPPVIDMARNKFMRKSKKTRESFAGTNPSTLGLGEQRSGATLAASGSATNLETVASKARSSGFLHGHKVSSEAKNVSLPHHPTNSELGEQARKLSGAGSLGTLSGTDWELSRSSGHGGSKEEWFSEYVQHGVTDRIARWALSFDNLLKDSFGLKIFTDFLLKEYSEENIEFWKDCQEYASIPHHDIDVLSTKAHSIYQKYLNDDAPSPVNVNANCRQCIKQNITETSSPDYGQIFDLAQAQIYTLMRYDSYPRFIKSDAYKDLVMREIEHKPNAYTDSAIRESQRPAQKAQVNSHPSHENMDDSMKKWKTNSFFSKSKLDNLLSSALHKGIALGEESRILNKYTDDLKKRRKGLADLVPIKVCKDEETTLLVEKDQLPSSTGHKFLEPGIPSLSTENEPAASGVDERQTVSLPSSHKSSLTDHPDDGLDNYLLSRYSFQECAPNQQLTPKVPGQSGGFCTFHVRQSAVYDPDPKLAEALTREITMVITPKPGRAEPVDDITIKRAILHICKLKGLEYSAVDVFTADKEPIDLNRSLSDFMGVGVYVEQRVLFQIILLPSGKSLGVKTRPNKDLAKVLTPILEMYAMEHTEDIDIYRESDGEKILLTDDVLKIDKSTIIVCPKKGAPHSRASLDNLKIPLEFPFKEPKPLPQSSTVLKPGRRRQLKRSITIDIDGPAKSTFPPSRFPPKPQNESKFGQPAPQPEPAGPGSSEPDSRPGEIIRHIKSKDAIPRYSTEYFGEMPGETIKEHLSSCTALINPHPEARSLPPIAAAAAVKPIDSTEDLDLGQPRSAPDTAPDPNLPYYAGNASYNNSNGHSSPLYAEHHLDTTLTDLTVASRRRRKEKEEKAAAKLTLAVKGAGPGFGNPNRRASFSLVPVRRLSKFFGNPSAASHNSK